MVFCFHAAKIPPPAASSKAARRKPHSLIRSFLIETFCYQIQFFSPHDLFCTNLRNRSCLQDHQNMSQNPFFHTGVFHAQSILFPAAVRNPYQLRFADTLLLNHVLTETPQWIRADSVYNSITTASSETNEKPCCKSASVSVDFPLPLSPLMIRSLFLYSSPLP